MSWLKRITWVLGGILLAAGFVLLLGSVRWQRTSDGVADRLREQGSRASAAFSHRDLNGLPAPVARYFRQTLREGQPLIRIAEIHQEGEFRVGTDESSWRPFRATHVAVAEPPGFMWDARIVMAPLLSVRVRDAYVGGRGSMHGEILAVYTLIDEKDQPELDSGALQRYLAEAVWFPTALLPSQGVSWEAIDDYAARATLTDSRTTVSLEFRFNDAGEIIGSYATSRFREVNGSYVPTPWGGRYGRYEERQGMRIPLEGEVEWHLPDRTLPYWRGRIVEARYDAG
jgi:hypothetical protein